MAPRIMVTGSSSLVGSHFIETLATKYEMSAIGRTNIFGTGPLLRHFSPVDITHRSSLERAVSQSRCEALVNFAAFTDVDASEAEVGKTEDLVFRTNSTAVRWMAEICKANGIVMYQVSTDAVFDGSDGPYSEEDKAGPVERRLSWYGQSKYIGELGLIESGTEYCLIRISHPYRARFAHKLDFARRMLALFGEGKLYPLFADQVFTPTLVDDVSAFLDLLIERDLRGTFHVASPVLTTPYEFGKELLNVFFPGDKRIGAVRKGSVREFNEVGGHAPRPIKGGLRVGKVQSLGFNPTAFKDGILTVFRQSKAGSAARPSL